MTRPIFEASVEYGVINRMNTWMKVAVAFSVPLMIFMVTRDTVDGFYGPDRSASGAAYIVQ